MGLFCRGGLSATNEHLPEKLCGAVANTDISPCWLVGLCSCCDQAFLAKVDDIKFVAAVLDDLL